MPRRVALALVLVLALAAPASAGAHGGATDGTDYRTTIDDVPAGLEVRVVGGDDRLALTRTTAASVTVMGYGGEPYLRLDGDGVWENRSSPAVALNAERQPTAALAGADAPPDWVLTDPGRTAVFHDHRAHWMASQPPAAVRADPGRPYALPDWSVPVTVDGTPTAITGGLAWVGTPRTGLWWLLTGAALAAGVAVGLMLRRHLLAAAGLGAAAAVTAGAVTGASQRLDLPDGTTGALLVIAIPVALLGAGAVVAWRAAATPAIGATGFLLVAVIAGGASVVGELDTAFGYALVPGPLPTLGTRIALVLGVGGLGLVAGATARTWVLFVRERAPVAGDAAW